MSEPYDSTQETQEHINQVNLLAVEVRRNWALRALNHDASKLESPEKEMFDEYTPRLRALTYGSPEYEAVRQEMLRTALAHHYAKNAHHPEHWPVPVGQSIDELRATIAELEQREGSTKERVVQGWLEALLVWQESRINGMSLLDILEMLVDWRAATMRHADGDLAKSLEINRTRFGISDQLYSILVNTAREMGWIE